MCLCLMIEGGVQPLFFSGIDKRFLARWVAWAFGRVGDVSGTVDVGVLNILKTELAGLPEFWNINVGGLGRWGKGV